MSRMAPLATPEWRITMYSTAEASRLRAETIIAAE